jgi:hypothetical protein
MMHVDGGVGREGDVLGQRRRCLSEVPEIASEWHPTLNGDLTPDHVTAGSGKVAWWICPSNPDHAYQARIAHRTTR